MAGTAYDIQGAVPAELQSLRQWVCWRLDVRSASVSPAHIAPGVRRLIPNKEAKHGIVS